MKAQGSFILQLEKLLPGDGGVGSTGERIAKMLEKNCL